MSPARRAVSRSPAVNRLVREFRESPAKAIVLSVGVLAALWVWVPRLLPAADSGEPTASTDEFGEPTAVGESVSDFSMRDSLSIRSEFIAIYEEARHVRRFADPWLGATSERDPFVREAPLAIVPIAEPSSAEEQERREEVAADEAALAEAQRASKHELRGVFDFGKSKSALFADRVVRVGDVVDGFEIVAIATRSLKLRGAFGEYIRKIADPLDPNGDTRDSEEIR